MATSRCSVPMIDESSLESWKIIDSGGFGQVYKARHRVWVCDVAVKLLHYDDGNYSSMRREIDMMRQGTSPYVMQVLGVFRGRPPPSGPTTQLGLVMEFMERGSLASLQVKLGGPPPWPLVVRLAHQVALGINFLHSLSPAVLHLDLKPSNVLLDSSLKAKLTDFGLAKISKSVTRGSKKGSKQECGTTNYMPPEAFDMNYRPNQASDIYSYGILLWSTVTGKPPYPNAMSSMVRFRIPEGDRPSLDEIQSLAADRTGLTGLMELMERCWRQEPTQRPSSQDCTTVTERLFKMQERAISDAVHRVLTELDEKEEEAMTEQVERLRIFQFTEIDEAANVLTGPPPVQEVAKVLTPNLRDEVRDQSTPTLASICSDEVGRSSKAPEVKVSSVHPIRSSPVPTLTPPTLPTPLTPPSRYSSSRTPEAATSAETPNASAKYHRQFSNIDPVKERPPSGGGWSINLSNVTGLMIGDNNSMQIHLPYPSERRRHPTAPPTVNLPPPQSGSSKNKKGGVG